MTRPVHVVGGGMAGCEAAWQLAQAGVPAVLHEMRPEVGPLAHPRAGGHNRGGIHNRRKLRKACTGRKALNAPPAARRIAAQNGGMGRKQV